MINKTSNKLHIIECLTKENIKLTNSIEIANEFGQYFAGVGKKFAERITAPSNSIDEYTSKINRHKNSLYLYHTNDVEIQSLIKGLPSKDSSGHDNISNNLLKKLGLCLTKLLVSIFNTSMQMGKFPESMKKADVVPLHKAKSREQTTNYRPISLLLKQTEANTHVN